MASMTDIIFKRGLVIKKILSNFKYNRVDDFTPV